MSWLLLLMVLGLGLLIPTAYAGWIGAPYAPTRLPVVKKAFALTGLGPGDTLFDLGAGDGKIVLEAARHGAQAVGVELSPIMWIIAWLRSLFFVIASLAKQSRSPRDLLIARDDGRDNRAVLAGIRPRIRFGNFYKKSLHDATHVFAFLMPENMPRVRAYLAQQRLAHGKFFLAYAFPFTDVEPLHVVRELNCAPLYIYDLRQLTREL